MKTVFLCVRVGHSYVNWETIRLSVISDLCLIFFGVGLMLRYIKIQQWIELTLNLTFRFQNAIKFEMTQSTVLSMVTAATWIYATQSTQAPSSHWDNSMQFDCSIWNWIMSWIDGLMVPPHGVDIWSHFNFNWFFFHASRKKTHKINA